MRQGRFQRITIKTLNDVGAFHYCWIRPGELIRLTASCVMRVSGQVMVLVLHNPKTARSYARQQFATLRDPVAIA